MSFVITKDHISDGAGVGQHGPRDAEHSVETIMNSPNKEYFKMYDDDDELYYEGYYLESDEEWETYGDMACELQPLDCYGTPNAGCSYLKMRNKKTGKLEVV